MDNFNSFFNAILNNLNLKLNRDLKIEEIRMIINKFNEFLYTNYDGIGNTQALEYQFEYISEFHKFWENHHQEILSPEVDINKCEELADKLHDIYINNKNVFYKLYNTYNLESEDVCKVRYFTANQDFRGSRDIEVYFKLYEKKPEIFDINAISKEPEDYIKNIGSTSLSQNDKRVKYASQSAKMLIEHNIEPYDLLEFYKGDIEKIRKFMISRTGAGFGNKKTDMFLRDMVVLKVWENPKNFEIIDVASDINTIKVALRTGILKTEIPLVSSFVDIFCHQYSLIDRMNALAWRKVWDVWKNKYPHECIEGPCLMDYLIYKIIGREFCRENLYEYKCDKENHKFKYKNGRLKYCKVCQQYNKKNTATVINRMLPCMDKDGDIVIANSKYVSGKDAVLPNIKSCPFKTVCKPNSDNFKKLNPPKSISILGRTGWDSARAKSKEGGGGLMA